MIYGSLFRFMHIFMGQQSRTFGCFLLNRTLCTFLIEFVQIVCVHTVVFGGESAWRAACSDSAYFGLDTLSSEGPLGGDPAHSRSSS